MATRSLPYADNEFDRAAYPDETIPTSGSNRIAMFPAKPNVPRDRYTRTGTQFAERLIEARNTGMPDAEHITTDDVDTGLVRLIEAADAWPASNVSKLAAGGVRSVSTRGGELLVVDMLVNPFAVMSDPMNGRTQASALSRQQRVLVPTEDDSIHRLPVYDLESVSELVDMSNASATDLGFRATRVAPGKDYQDLVSVGLEGVHEPLLLTPHLYRLPDGSSSWQLVADDGNRRLNMALRVLHDTAGLSWPELSAWSSHLWDGVDHRLRHWTADDVNALRRTASLSSYPSGSWYPTSQKEVDVQAFLRGPASRSIKIRSFLRCRALQARVVVGINTGSVSAISVGGRSHVREFVEGVVRRLHIAESAQKPWDDAAQAIRISSGALLAIQDSFEKGLPFLPLTLAEIVAVLNAEIVKWGSVPPDPSAHPLNLAAKTIAMFVCDDHDGTASVKEEMRQYGMSTHHSKIAANRARVAVDRVMPMLGFTDLSRGRDKQVRSAILRAIDSDIWTACDKHPDGSTDPWWKHIDTPAAELGDRSTAEMSTISDSGVANSTSVKIWGPATRALMLKALIAMAASPAVASAGSTASPFTVTLSGLGNTRGNTATDPDHLFPQLARHPRGIEQLVEIVRAAEAETPELPRNLIDPGHEVEGSPDTSGLFTEHFLRGEEFGWTRNSGASNESEEAQTDSTPTEYQRYQSWVERFTGQLEKIAAEGRAVLQEDDVLSAQFREHGLPGGDLKAHVDTITTVVQRGQFIAEG